MRTQTPTLDGDCVAPARKWRRQVTAVKSAVRRVGRGEVTDNPKSCGVILFRTEPVESFLLMRHADRWDLPKGHVDPGESETQCALRELAEETGIVAADVEIDPHFRFTTKYPVRSRWHGGEIRDKTLVIFLARLQRPADILVTEHLDYEWFPWQPPHQIQEKTIDPLLAAVDAYFRRTRG